MNISGNSETKYRQKEAQKYLKKISWKDSKEDDPVFVTDSETFAF